MYRECDKRCLDSNDESVPQEITMEHKLSDRRRIDTTVDLPNLWSHGGNKIN